MYPSGYHGGGPVPLSGQCATPQVALRWRLRSQTDRTGPQLRLQHAEGHTIPVCVYAARHAKGMFNLVPSFQMQLCSFLMNTFHSQNTSELG